MQRRLRIGELAAQTGVSSDVLRAWERRYALLEPSRSEGGFRLYSEQDEVRVRAMVRHIESGIPAREAARLVLEETEPAGDAWLVALSADLRRALDNFDEAGTQATLDTLIARLSFPTVASEVILPYLRTLGERWERGEISVAQEHFASVVLRGRLLALARGWDRGAGPRAILACAPGERHELGLLVFGLVLREHGWRITFLGADTPVETLLAATETLSPAAVILVALTPERLEPLRESMTELAGRTRLLLAGSGAPEALAAEIGAEPASGDPLESANRLAESEAKAAR